MASVSFVSIAWLLTSILSSQMRTKTWALKGSGNMLGLHSTWHGQQSNKRRITGEFTRSTIRTSQPHTATIHVGAKENGTVVAHARNNSQAALGSWALHFYSQTHLMPHDTRSRIRHGPECLDGLQTWLKYHRLPHTTKYLTFVLLKFHYFDLRHLGPSTRDLNVCQHASRRCMVPSDLLRRAFKVARCLIFAHDTLERIHSSTPTHTHGKCKKTHISN